MHKLQVIIKKELEEIPEGFKGIILNGHTVINIIDKLPEEFDYIRISAHVEYGSAKAKKKEGMAYILSDINGNPFKLFTVKEKGEGKFSTVFANITGKFITVNIERKGEYIKASITESEVIKPEDYVSKCTGITTKTLWVYTGDPFFAELPVHLIKYKQVFDSTIEKSKCRGCHCSHFYKEECNCE